MTSGLPVIRAESGSPHWTHLEKQSRDMDASTTAGHWYLPLPAWGFYDPIKGDKFNHIDFSRKLALRLVAMTAVGALRVAVETWELPSNRRPLHRLFVEALDALESAIS